MGFWGFSILWILEPGELFVPAMAVAFLVYLCLSAILPSDGYALLALAAVSDP